MGIASSILGSLYSAGRNIDRFLKVKRRLAHPVISVGNIASGGRAKTPMCVELVNGLRLRGFESVLLTRGYGRKNKEDLLLDSKGITLRSSGRFIPHEDLSGFQLLDWVGDEALEIFVKTGVNVLVGKRRAQNAQWWLRKVGGSTREIVYLLDDGFQHWALERDLDVVLYNQEDLEDEVLPLGRLREGREALSRADIVLELGKDVEKRTLYPDEKWDQQKAAFLSSRAESAEKIQDDPDRKFAEHLRLRDHASRQACLKALQATSFPQIVVGYKEAVKLVPWKVLEPYAGRPFFRPDLLEGKELFVCGLELEMRDAGALWTKIDYLLSEMFEATE